MRLTKLCKLLALLALPVALAAFAPQGSGAIADLQRQFETPPDDARIMMRWWWFGPAVTKPELERELRLMKEAGIGGVEIQPVYPLALDAPGAKNLRFLSKVFLDAVQFTNAKARELGLRVDVTVGSGWPYGGPSVPVQQAASRLRVERLKVTAAERRVPLPDLAEGEKLLAVFHSQQGHGQRELTEIKDGAVWLPPDSAGELLCFIASRTGQQVKRPALGAEGFVLDHYDRAALDDYLRKVGEPLLQAFGAQPPQAVFCDSLEVFSSDWTGDLLEEFQRRRGYDLKPLLPALVNDAVPQHAAIRHDWGQTLTELVNERFMAPLSAWARQHNTRLRMQGYGLPPATIASNGLVDLSEGEGPQWKVLRAARWASSANHLYGRNITSSETWTWLHSPAFRATPLDVKAEADLHFLQGVNQLIGHGWPYTPEGVAYPGWRFYAAGVFNEKNPWWIAMPDVARYLQRVSFLLRQGAPANDVAFYLPNSDAWAGFKNGKVHYMIEALKDRLGDDAVAQVLEAGFNLDFFDDDVLRQIGKVEAGALALGPNKYKAVILPNVERMPLDTLRQLAAFAEQGGVVLAARRAPDCAPGFKAGADERAEIRALSQRLFAGRAQVVADEKQLGAQLAARLRPDVRLTPAVPDIGFIHRRTAEAEIYFLANSSNLTQRVTAAFNVKDAQAELWNPFDGGVTLVAAQAGSLPLEFEPYGSRIVVFSNRRGSVVSKPNVNAAPIDLNTGWQVSFGEGQPQTLEKLRSWTEDEATRFYSGTASYERAVNVPAALLQTGARLTLDFGAAQAIPTQPRKNGIRAWLDAPLRDAAVVYVNGARAGAVWCPPYALDVTRLLKPGANQLRLVVGNTAINHLAGRRQPDYKLLNLRYGERFQAQDMENLQPLPSGLLGPVRLVPEH